jgi:hypothetical protein
MAPFSLKTAFGLTGKMLLVSTLLCQARFAESVAEPPVVIPAQKAEPQDRKDGAGMAAGLAAMGAAVAGMSCLELYRQAREIEPVDPAQASQLRAMAAMQCSQAAQSAADAAKNQDSKERLSLNDTPTGQNAAQTDPPKAANPQSPFSAPGPFEAETTREIADASNFREPEPTVFEPKEISGSSLGITQNPSARGDSLTKLSPIEPSILGVNEGNGVGMAVAGQNASPNFGGVPGASSNSAPRASNGEIKEPEGLLRKKMAASETPTDHTGSESASSENGAEESSASSVLARLLGGGTEGGDALLGGQIADIELPKGGTMRSANIFEYVSYRMKKSRIDGEIKIGKAKVAANSLNRNLTAVTP